ncbi:protein adenylyltransferase SelO [Aureimonas sp. SA4125]|uniref:protein adenylyltransferase SelO n=1 Tax=Aureimonas sp. SA4125 TaxID=2826993 RepID=UPI001CC58CAD|nr:YdiU family protein [Aureimonas sp. SA4125]
MTIHIPFDNSYARLPGSFHARIEPSAASAPRLLKLNRALAETLGLDPAALETQEAARWFAGSGFPEGAEPIALAYAGHQFGNFVPQLGDGRAVLLGEIVGRDGQRRDIQLKGSGPTPFSRGGDGRAALGPVVREYLVSEAMAALGVPSTRALAMVATGDQVWRDTVLPGAVLARVAASHIRVGTFQFFAARGDDEAVRRLADYAIARHYPAAADADCPALALLGEVATRQAELVARWMLIGFVHGVMNTDNMAISGETIDYGPCAFLDVYDPSTVFSSIDRGGRYAYANQPGIAQWNLTRLAECLLPLIDADEARAIERAKVVLAGYAETFQQAYLAGMRRKLGLMTAGDGDLQMAQDLLGIMADGKADFTLTFRGLGAAAADPAAIASVAQGFADPAPFMLWAEGWLRRLGEEAEMGRAEAMRTANPAFIPRNAQVEAVIAAAVENGDFAPFETLASVLARPYEDQPENDAYAIPPASSGEAYRTFCGT